jgi:hypothetical protein
LGSLGRQHPILSEILRASIHRLGKIEVRPTGLGPVSAIPTAIAAIGAAVTVASRNNITVRHPRSITTLPSVRTVVVVVEAAAVLTVAAVEVRLLPAMAEVAAEAALPAAVIAAVKQLKSSLSRSGRLTGLERHFFVRHRRPGELNQSLGIGPRDGFYFRYA